MTGSIKEIKQRQRFLKSRGFDCGKIDGAWGPWSQRAENAFAESMRDLEMVMTLQKEFNKRGAKLKADGIYGPETREAERLYWDAFQQVSSPPTAPAKAVLGSDREKVIQVALSLVGVREKTGKNDGPLIDDILGSCGLRGRREPYCACTIVYCGDMAFGRDRNPYPRSAWSPDLVAKPTWQQGMGGKLPRPGDAFGIYFASKRRVAHCGLIYEWKEKEPFCLTIEGNTGPTGSVGEADRNGQGIFLKRRMKSDVHSVRDWIG